MVTGQNLPSVQLVRPRVLFASLGAGAGRGGGGGVGGWAWFSELQRPRGQICLTAPCGAGVDEKEGDATGEG